MHKDFRTLNNAVIYNIMDDYSKTAFDLFETKRERTPRE